MTRDLEVHVDWIGMMIGDVAILLPDGRTIIGIPGVVGVERIVKPGSRPIVRLELAARLLETRDGETNQ